MPGTSVDAGPLRAPPSSSPLCHRLMRISWSLLGMLLSVLLAGTACEGPEKPEEDTSATLDQRTSSAKGSVPPLPLSSAPGTFWVQHRGAMRSVMRDGDLTPRVALDSLQRHAGLFAVGPLEGLRGEVTIYNGVPSIATVSEGVPQTTPSFDHRAVFLVYGGAEAWTSAPITEEVGSLGALEAYVRQAAERAGLSTDEPFPFRIEGTATDLTYHILDRQGDGPHTGAAHQAAKKLFSARKVEVQMVGFWGSAADQGVFIHRGDHIHVHAILTAADASGHVDALQLAAGDATLFLPVR